MLKASRANVQLILLWVGFFFVFFFGRMVGFLYICFWFIGSKGFYG